MDTNYITNPELDPSGGLPQGVYPGGGSGSIAFAGSAPDTYARWTLTATGSGFSVGQNLFPNLGVQSGITPGLTYSGRFDMRYSRVTTLRGFLQFMQGNFTMTGSTELDQTAVANTWQTFSFDGLVAPANTDGVRLLAYCAVYGQQAGDTLDVRHPLVTEAATAGDFFSGATPDTDDFTYAWTGTPHQSSSTRTVAEAPAAPELTLFDGTTWRPLGGYHVITA